MRIVVCLHWLVAATVAASLPVAVQAAPGHTMGGFAGGAPHHNAGGFAGSGSHLSMGQRFGHGRFFDHDHFFAHDRFFDHHRFVDRDRFFFRHRNRFIFIFDFAAFGFPWWYPDFYDWYPDYYPYYSYGPVYDPKYWTNLAVSVQSALVQRGYYHGPADGEIGPDSREAIRAFQASEGLPVTGMIDPKLLKAMGINYKAA